MHTHIHLGGQAPKVPWWKKFLRVPVTVPFIPRLTDLAGTWPGGFPVNPDWRVMVFPKRKKSKTPPVVEEVSA